MAGDESPRLEVDSSRWQVMSWLTGLGVVVAGALTVPVILGPMSCPRIGWSQPTAG
jgi:hypothetical protein